MTISDGGKVAGAMELYCAVDIMDGGAVRLTQGDFGRRTEHGDPVALALQFVKEGARFLHVVDLDAARDGEPVNRRWVLRIVEEAGVPVQIGGGVRAYEDAALLLDAGAARVVVSTAAVEEPEMLDELASRYPYRIALGLDHRSSGATDHRSSGTTDHRSSGTTDHRSSETAGVEGEIVAVRGWEQGSGVTVEALLQRFAERTTMRRHSHLHRARRDAPQAPTQRVWNESSRLPGSPSSLRVEFARRPTSRISPQSPSLQETARSGTSRGLSSGGHWRADRSK